eukprot:Hpha_TRINITY_DN14226_c0_g1::TRINITY_DN14226_c0_g1_i1::g.22637::m.22637
MGDFPESLGPFGVVALPPLAYPEFDPCRVEPPPGLPSDISYGSHGWYELDTLFSGERLCLTVRTIQGEAVSFTGMHISAVRKEAIDVTHAFGRLPSCSSLGRTPAAMALDTVPGLQVSSPRTAAQMALGNNPSREASPNRDREAARPPVYPQHPEPPHTAPAAPLPETKAVVRIPSLSSEMMANGSMEEAAPMETEGTASRGSRESSSQLETSLGLPFRAASEREVEPDAPPPPPPPPQPAGEASDSTPLTQGTEPALLGGRRVSSPLPVNSSPDPGERRPTLGDLGMRSKTDSFHVVGARRRSSTLNLGILAPKTPQRDGASPAPKSPKGPRSPLAIRSPNSQKTPLSKADSMRIAGLMRAAPTRSPKVPKSPASNNSFKNPRRTSSDAQVLPSIEELEETLPGMRVHSVDGQLVRTPEELQEKLDACGSVFTIVVQDDDATPLLPFYEAGILGFGPIGPRNVVTLPVAERRAALIPESAAEYCMAYPLAGLHNADEEVAAEVNLADPLGAFAIFGGFLYLDEDGLVVGANALTQGDMLHFDGPFPWRREYTELLRSNGRLVPVTLRALKDKGAQEFAYLIPGETLSGPGLPSWRVTKHGGFVYLGSGCSVKGLRSRVQSAAFSRRHSASSQYSDFSEASLNVSTGHSPKLPESVGFDDCFFVMLGGENNAGAANWELLRICPHCSGQQPEPEDQTQGEVMGAMRCENCGMLSALEEKQSLDKENLYRMAGTLLLYVVLLVSYILAGAWVIQGFELPHERNMRDHAVRNYDHALNLATEHLIRMENRTAAEIREYLEKFTSELNDGKCVPNMELNWEHFKDAMFICFTMVITIPDILPVTTAGRLIFVFYLIGGLVCVLNVIFDIANVIPSIFKEVLMLLRKSPKGKGRRQSGKQIMKVSEDLFDIVDYNSSGSLSMEEFLEYLQLYEHPEPVDDDLLAALIVKVDKDGQELGRDAVQKATVLWEKMKEEATQVPGSIMVGTSVLGNLLWILVCALLYNHIEGFQVGEALWLCFLTLTTVGFGTFAPKTTRGQLLTYFFFLVGLGWMAWMMNAIGSKGKQNLMRHVRKLFTKFNCWAREVQKVWVPVEPPVRFFAPNDEHGLFCPVYPAQIDIGGTTWPSVLHFVTYERFRGTRHEGRLRRGDAMASLEIMTETLSAAPLPRDGWEEQRDDVMLTAIFQRVSQDKHTHDLLLSTGERMLIFDITEAKSDFVNAFELKHWGVASDGAGGLNRLGELLQMIRSDIRKGRKTDLRPGVCSATPITFFGYTNPQYAVFTPSFPASFTGRETPPLKWATVDHFFQAKKFKNEAHRERIRCARTHHEAIELGRDRNFELQQNWDFMRQFVMFEAQVQKFAQNPRARTILLQTGTRTLLFADDQNGYWGTGLRDDGITPGENVLGNMLMAVRERLRQGISPKQMLQDNDDQKVVWTSHQTAMQAQMGKRTDRKKSRLSRISIRRASENIIQLRRASAGSLGRTASLENMVANRPPGADGIVQAASLLRLSKPNLMVPRSTSATLGTPTQGSPLGSPFCPPSPPNWGNAADRGVSPREDREDEGSKPLAALADLPTVKSDNFFGLMGAAQEAAQERGEGGKNPLTKPSLMKALKGALTTPAREDVPDRWPRGSPARSYASNPESGERASDEDVAQNEGNVQLKQDLPPAATFSAFQEAHSRGQSPTPSASGTPGTKHL